MKFFQRLRIADNVEIENPNDPFINVTVHVDFKIEKIRCKSTDIIVTIIFILRRLAINEGLSY